LIGLKWIHFDTPFGVSNVGRRVAPLIDDRICWPGLEGRRDAGGTFAVASR
jgi:hypothetical protein